MTDIIFTAEVLVFALAALGPAGLLGYVWKTSAWKAFTESRLAAVEKAQESLGQRDTANMEMLQRIYEKVSSVETDQKVQHAAVEVKITQGLADLETKLSERSSAGRKELYSHIDQHIDRLRAERNRKR